LKTVKLATAAALDDRRRAGALGHAIRDVELDEGRLTRDTGIGAQFGEVLLP
jgi:hypothetical protein